MRAIKALLVLSGVVGGLAVAAPATAETLVVSLDHSMRISVQGQAASVVVGNSAVADVSVVDSHTLFISGKSIGQTDVSVLDGYGRTIFSSDVAVSANGPGRVAVYRGPDRTDFACAPGCAPQAHQGAQGGQGGASGGASGGAPAAPGK